MRPSATSAATLCLHCKLVLLRTSRVTATQSRPCRPTATLSLTSSALLQGFRKRLPPGSCMRPARASFKTLALHCSSVLLPTPRATAAQSRPCLRTATRRSRNSPALQVVRPPRRALPSFPRATTTAGCCCCCCSCGASAAAAACDGQRHGARPCRAWAAARSGRAILRPCPAHRCTLRAPPAQRPASSSSSSSSSSSEQKRAAAAAESFLPVLRGGAAAASAAAARRLLPACSKRACLQQAACLAQVAVG
jgi:hypothetical protein